MFEATYASLEDVPEAFRDHFIEVEGREGVHIDVKGGLKTNDDIDRLNGALAKEREDHKSAKKRIKLFGEHTPETIETMVNGNDEMRIKLEGLEGDSEEGMKKVAELVTQRTNAALSPVQRELDKVTEERNELTTERDSLRGERDRSKITSAVMAAAQEAGVRDVVLTTDLPGWAMQTFELAEGVVVSKDGLPPKDVMLDLKGSNLRPHWFGETISAGAGGGEGGASSTKNPFDRKGKDFNLGQAMGLLSSNPALGARLAKEAGYNTKTGKWS